MAQALDLETWSGEDVKLGEVETALARLRSLASQDSPSMRTSVMTHIAWVPPEWQHAAEETLAGMAERHPSRTLLLVPHPELEDGLDALVSVRCFPFGDRAICGEVIDLTLRGGHAAAPASIALPLLISDLPVFLRWRGMPEWDSGPFEQLVGVTDRLIVDSTEWDDLPYPYRHLVQLFDRAAVSDIAWARTSRWRRLLASLWPGIADVRTIRVHGTAAQAHLLHGWLRSRLERDDIALEHVEAERLEGIDLDGEAAPFPPGDPPQPSDVLSDELDRFTRDRVYEASVAAVVASRNSTYFGTTSDHASITSSCISPTSSAASRTTAQLNRRSDGPGNRYFSGSDSTSASRHSFGNAKPISVSSREKASQTIWPTRNFTRPRTSTS